MKAFKLRQQFDHWILISVMIFGAILRLRGIDNPLLDDQAWRQSDTAGMALHMAGQLGRFPEVLFPKLSYDGVTPQIVELELPLFPYLLAWTWYFLGQRDVWGRLWAVVFSTFSIGGLYVLGRRLYSPRVGLVAATIYAIVPLSVYYGRVIMPEPLTQALAIWALNAVLWYRTNPKLSKLVVAGFILALAILTKLPQAMILPVALIFGFREKGSRALQNIRSAVIYCVLALTVPACYYLAAHRLSSSSGQFVSGIISHQVVQGTGYWEDLLYNLQKGLTIPILALILWALIRLFIRLFTGLIKTGFIRNKMLNAFQLETNVLGIGVWLLISFVYMAIICARIPLDYYLLPVLPPIALLIGVLMSEWPLRQVLMTSAVLIVLVVYAGNTVLAEKLRWDDRYLIQANWIKENTPEQSVLVLSDPFPMTFYYSQRVGFRLTGSDEEFWQMLDDIPGDFLVKLPGSSRSEEFWKTVEHLYPEVGPGVYQLYGDKLVKHFDKTRQDSP